MKTGELSIGERRAILKRRKERKSIRGVSKNGGKKNEITATAVPILSEGAVFPKSRQVIIMTMILIRDQ